MPLKKLPLLLLLFCCYTNLSAQETQVPFCAGVERITPNMAAELEEFQQFEGFQYANLYIDADSVYTIEIYYKPEDNVLRQRRGISERELGNMCQIIFDQNLMETVEVELDQEGRTELILSSMSLGLLYYSWAVPSLLGVDDGRAYISSYLLIGGSSFFVPFLATRNKEITAGMARGYNFGGVLGIPHGISAAALLLGDEASYEAVVGMGMIGSIAESVVGLKYAQRNQLSHGHMSLIGNGGTWGALYGVVIPVIAQSSSTRLYGFSTLATSGLGIYAGHKIASSYNVSDGDAAVISTLGALGAFAPLIIIVSIDDYAHESLVFTSMILGSASAMALGVKKAKIFDYTLDHGMYLGGGALGGMLTGLGLTYLIGGDNADFRAYLWSAGLGATGGFFLTDYLIRRGSQNNNTTSGLQLDVNPMGLYNFGKAENEVKSIQNQNQQQPYLFRATYRF